MSAKKKKSGKGVSSERGQTETPNISNRFTDAPVPQSRTPKQAGNLTGLARKVKDSCADLHNYTNKWDSISNKGQEIISLIANIKLKNILKDEGERTELELDTHLHVEELQTLCEKLEKVFQTLEKIIGKLEGISRTLKGVCDLEWHQNGQAVPQHPLFLTWQTKQFYDTATNLTKMYKKELDLRRTIIENIAHTDDRDLMMFYTSAWLHQPYIDSDTQLLLESCLVETGHR
ncbi:cyclin-dependent kinase 2-interacting protein-like [Lineus longissimus]|uniref:cyclin-dependent kinase 2-interacting protein-like n=1 Tax=Lineus longissimus TaxID=88925 RepID=UPI002B4CF55A